MTELAITNATVVLPDRTIKHGTVEITAGRISDIRASSPLANRGPHVIDAGGAYLMPGLVDIHNDSLEIEVNPRPGTNLPLPFALNNCERRLVAAGVTTEFHAIGFMNRPSAERTVNGARERTAFIAGLKHDQPRIVEHFVLHRINVRDREALPVVIDSLSQFELRYASLDDHTPGQGQFQDPEVHYERLREIAERRGEEPPSRAEFEQRMIDAAGDTTTVPYVHTTVQAEARRRSITLASHDDHTPEKVDCLHDLGARVAEFPITVDAAQRARERGMWIVVGAPNLVRGGSQIGNVSAADLIERDLADIVCADYHAPSMLAAVFKMERERLRDLPSAVRTVTQNPARAVGLTDRGAIEPGQRADLIQVRLDNHGFPHVEATYSRGHRVFTLSGRTQPATPRPLEEAFADR